MNIVLIGYRGTGKSTVAEMLAQKLNMKAYHLDEMIVERAGMTIPEIVEKHGWDWFRDMESEVTADASSRDNAVLDCGGGVILRERNVENLRRNGKVFLLTATPETVIDRIQEDTNRPALKDGKTFLEEVEEVLAERQPLYDAAADVVIETDSRTPLEVTEEILRLLRGE